MAGIDLGLGYTVSSARCRREDALSPDLERLQRRIVSDYVLAGFRSEEKVRLQDRGGCKDEINGSMKEFP